MKIETKVIIRHRFWGEYSEQIIVSCESEMDARLVRGHLAGTTPAPSSTVYGPDGAGRKPVEWTVIEAAGDHYVACVVSGEDIDNAYDALWGDDETARPAFGEKSIDHSSAPATFEVEDPRQMQLQIDLP